MARAKRTDRTAARRRHRAELAGLTESESATQPASSSSARSGSKAAAPTAPVKRPSITAAFRGAVRPLDIRGDLLALPKVVTNWGFLAAVALTVVAAGWFVIAYNDAMAAVASTAPVTELEKVVGDNSIPYFVATMAMQPPPAIGAFLIGFAAKRGSWLGGLIYGIVVALVAVVILQLPAGRLLTGTGRLTRCSLAMPPGRRSVPRCSRRQPPGTAASWTCRTRTAPPSASARHRVAAT